MAASWSGEFAVTAVNPTDGTMTIDCPGAQIIMEAQYKAADMQVVVTMDGVAVPAQVGDVFLVRVRRQT
jgi:hypothetical protein